MLNAIIGSGLPVLAPPVKGVEPGSSQPVTKSVFPLLFVTFGVRDSRPRAITNPSGGVWPSDIAGPFMGERKKIVENQTPSPAPAMLSPEEVVQQLRALREQIPLPDALPAMPTQRRRRLAHVNAQFVVAAINAAGASPAIQTALGRNDEDLRLETDVSERWTAVIDEVRSLLQTLVDANTLRRQSIGLAALQTYKICQQLARDDGHATRLATHIGEMKKLNKFGRPRRQAPQPAPQPQPQPAQ